MKHLKNLSLGPYDLESRIWYRMWFRVHPHPTSFSSVLVFFKAHPILDLSLFLGPLNLALEILKIIRYQHIVNHWQTIYNHEDLYAAFACGLLLELWLPEPRCRNNPRGWFERENHRKTVHKNDTNVMKISEKFHVYVNLTWIPAYQDQPHQSAMSRILKVPPSCWNCSWKR